MGLRFTIVLTSVLIFVFSFSFTGCKSKSESGVVLEGTWFVEYASDPKPYLDVEFGKGNTSIASVKADLACPEKTYDNLALSFNKEENEWQLVCDFLPKPLVGGLWWIKKLDVITKDGMTYSYTATTPYSNYMVTEGNGSRDTGMKPGVFYATETKAGQSTFFIKLTPKNKNPQVDPEIFIYESRDTEKWFAMNADSDVDQTFPALAVPMAPGKTYYIKVEGQDGGGVYVISINKGSYLDPSSIEGLAKDMYEPNDNQEQATRIKAGETQVHTISDDNSVDWFVFTAPEND